MPAKLVPVKMAPVQAKPNIGRNPRRPPVSKGQGKRSPDIKIKPQQTPRKSLRLQALYQCHEQSSPKINHTQEVQTPLSPPASNILEGNKSKRKRKRREEEQEEEEQEEAGREFSHTQKQHLSKRLQTSPSNCLDKETSPQASASGIDEGSTDPIQHWIETGRWRKEYFEQDSQVKEDFEKGKSPETLEQRDWLREHYTREPFRKMPPFAHHLQHFFARKKSSTSLRRKLPQSSLQTSSEQPSRESKSSQYNNPDYKMKLEDKGSYMYSSPLGITDTSQDLCRSLLEKEQEVPRDSLFRDDLFDETCECVSDRNEAMIARDITPLICPSAQILRIYGAKHLSILYESVNEAWSCMEEFEGTPPQPDYSVGFGRSAFTKEQMDKLKPFVGDPWSKLITYFMATTRIYFPFLTCEVKGGGGALNIADRQNAQSMSIALRALVVLFRSVKREKELDRQILTFSISHDDKSVRIYGHYPVIEGDKTSFYRHLIRGFTIDSREKWTAYKLTKNVYDHHSLELHRLICSAIDDLPSGVNFSLSQSASFSQSTPQGSRQSNADSTPRENDSRSSIAASQEATPTTSFAQPTEPASKKARKKQAGGQQR